VHGQFRPQHHGRGDLEQPWRWQAEGLQRGQPPSGKVNPFALALLKENRLPTDALRSKSWDEFAQPAAPFMHFIFTVCDEAAAEMCPVWPGKPTTGHWGVPDPAAVEGTDQEKRRAFLSAYATLFRRIGMFTSLPFDKLQGLALKERIDEIGRVQASDRGAA